MRITLADFRVAGICPTSRKWFEKHGLDWREFVREGIDSEKLRATGDHLGKIAELEIIAERRNGRRQQ